MRKQTKKNLIGIFSIIFGILYLSNIGSGFVEIIPDIIPVFGNIDEGLAGALILFELNTLRGKKWKYLKKQGK